MGSVTVPASAYYGAQTQRALDNFRISGLVFPRRFIRALGIVKEAAACVNMQLGLFDSNHASVDDCRVSDCAGGSFSTPSDRLHQTQKDVE